MAIHLIKLSVGPDSLADMASWQKQRLKDLKAQGRKPELIHVTRQMPKRAEELLDGGSIYWVIKGWVVARQRIMELRPMEKNGLAHCGIVLDKKIVPVRWQQRRAFQGWRYLDPKDAPEDTDGRSPAEDLPESLRQELAALGLL